MPSDVIAQSVLALLRHHQSEFALLAIIDTVHVVFRLVHFALGGAVERLLVFLYLMLIDYYQLLAATGVGFTHLQSTTQHVLANLQVELVVAVDSCAAQLAQRLTLAYLLQKVAQPLPLWL